MSIEKKKIEELISTAKRITENQKGNRENLLFEIGKNQDSEFDKWESLLEGDTLQDPKKSYDLFYGGIQSFLLKLMPKSDTRTVILELKNILLTGKEKRNISYGVRGADSRMSKTVEMEAIIDVLTGWSVTPDDFFKLTTMLLDKNKELGFVPEERVFWDYIRGKR